MGLVRLLEDHKTIKINIHVELSSDLLRDFI